MNQGTTNSASDIGRPDQATVDRELVRKARTELLQRLHQMGIPESELIVARVRQPKRHQGVVGYYSNMSQFRSKARIVVHITAIRAEVPEHDVYAEVLKTIAHEYGHIIAEMIRHMAKHDPMKVPCWKGCFQADEELFAEDFARHLVGDLREEPQFWEQFIPELAAEYRRVFLTQ